MTPDESKNQRNLDAEFAGGLAWTAGAKSATQVFSWISVLVIARLLPPSDVGISEIAGIFYNLTNVLAEFGIGTAVLHMPELERRTLGQLHLFSMFVSSGLAALAFVAAPGLAWFFHSPHTAFFAATSVGFLITGFQAVPFGLLQRDMDYRRLALVEAISALVQTGVGMAAAFMGLGYWALFCGVFAAKAAGAIVVCYWIRVPFYWPRWTDIKRPVQMGQQLAIGRLAGAAFSFADVTVVGRTMGEAALGIYRMATNLASAPAEKITSLIMRTASPLFANVMNDISRVRRYYLIITELMTLTMAPAMVGLWIIAPDAIHLLIGQKWAQATGPLQWLCLFMILRGLGALSEQVLVSQFQAGFTMRMSLLNLILMPLAFYGAGKWMGISGVAAAWLVMSPVTFLPYLILVVRRIQLNWLQFANALLPSLVGSLVMGVALLALRSWHGADSWPLAVRLVLQISASGAVYGATLLIFFRPRISRYVNFIINLRRARLTPEPVAVPE